MSQPGEAPAQASEYQYDTLPAGQFIRMLTLYPGTLDDPLEGKLELFDINSCETYESLSYVWGEQERRHEIICTGQRLLLTTSIHDALRRLRKLDRPRRLWADQICINQADKAERSQQVQFMNHIYNSAKHVLVWLGPDNPPMAKRAFKLVHELQERFQDEKECEKFQIDHTDRLEERSEDAWIPLMKVTHLPWVSLAEAVSSPRNECYLC